MDPSAPSSLPPMPPAVSLVAPLLIGALVNTFLFGILSVQLYFYYLSFPSDALYLKVLVYGVYILDTAATLMNISDTFKWVAEGFGDIMGLDRVLLSPVYTPIFGSIIAGTVQSFYAWRIFKIERKAWPVSVFVLLVVLTQIAGGFWGGIVAMREKSFMKAGAAASGSPWIIFVGAAVADTVIALTVIILLSQKQLTSHRQVRASLSKIIQLTAETNILSTVVALVTMILFASEKGTNYFTMPSFILGKVYSNSLLLILNNRYYLAADANLKSGRGNNTFGSSQNSSNPQSSTAVSMNVFKSKSQQEKERSRGIHVDVNTLVDSQSQTESKAGTWAHDNVN